MCVFPRHRARAFPRRGKGVHPQPGWTRSSEAWGGPGQGVRVAVLREQECESPAHRPGHVAGGRHPEDTVQELPRCPEAGPAHPCTPFSRVWAWGEMRVLGFHRQSKTRHGHSVAVWALQCQMSPALPLAQAGRLSCGRRAGDVLPTGAEAPDRRGGASVTAASRSAHAHLGEVCRPHEGCSACPRTAVPREHVSVPGDTFGCRMGCVRGRCTAAN